MFSDENDCCLRNIYLPRIMQVKTLSCIVLFQDHKLKSWIYVHVTYSQPMNFVYFRSVFYTIAFRSIKFLFENSYSYLKIMWLNGEYSNTMWWGLSKSETSVTIQIHQTKIPLLLLGIVLVRQYHSFVIYLLVSDITWVLHLLLYNNIMHLRHFSE